MSSFWWNFHHWLHWQLSFWQLPVQPVMKISSKWRHFRFSEGHRRHVVSLGHSDFTKMHHSGVRGYYPDSNKLVTEPMLTYHFSEFPQHSPERKFTASSLAIILYNENYVWKLCFSRIINPSRHIRTTPFQCISNMSLNAWGSIITNSRNYQQPTWRTPISVQKDIRCSCKYLAQIPRSGGCVRQNNMLAFTVHRIWFTTCRDFCS